MAMVHQTVERFTIATNSVCVVGDFRTQKKANIPAYACTDCAMPPSAYPVSFHGATCATTAVSNQCALEWLPSIETTVPQRQKELPEMQQRPKCTRQPAKVFGKRSLPCGHETLFDPK